MAIKTLIAAGHWFPRRSCGWRHPRVFTLVLAR